MNVARIFLDRPGDPEYEGWALTIIGFLDENDRLLPRFHTGFQGSLKEKSPHMWPFVLRNDGRVDFGFNSEGEDFQHEERRFGRLNIFGRRLSIGEVVSYKYGDNPEEVYRITVLEYLTGEEK